MITIQRGQGNALVDWLLAFGVCDLGTGGRFARLCCVQMK
jgi:hypothetical protein